MPAHQTWAVLPVKPFGAAKSRLAAVLDVAARGDLARRLMLHSLAALQACRSIDSVLVVSSDPEALSLASQRGARALIETRRGLNQALNQAREVVMDRDASRLLVMASDLPLVTPAEIEALCAVQGAGVAIAPDSRRLGTNALLLQPPGAIDFAFGARSLRRHRELARAAGFAAREVWLPGLAFDIDLPEDLRRLDSIDSRPDRVQAAGTTAPA